MELSRLGRDFILRPALGGGHAAVVDISKRSRTVAAEPVEEIRRLIAALTDASTQRHRLERGTAEYVSALETEERLADHVWRLGASLEPSRQRRSTERRAAKTPKT